MKNTLNFLWHFHQSAVMAQVKNITCEAEKKMPRALFSGVMGITKRLINCDDCGLMLHQSNLARHNRHCGHCLQKGTTRGIKIRFKLPGVRKALNMKVSWGEECQSPDLGHLLPTPQTDEEFTWSLTKL